MSKKIPILFLAAGKSSRTSPYLPKGLIQVDGKPWLINQLLKVSPKRKKYVVLGYHFELYSNALREFVKEITKIIPIQNHNPERGQFSSLLTGLNKILIDNEYKNGVIVHPMDVPLIGEKLIDLFDNEPSYDVIKPTFNGKSGHPIWLGPNIISDLLQKEKEMDSFRLDEYLKTIPKEKVKYLETNFENITKNLNTKDEWDNFIPDHKILIKEATIVLSSKEFVGDLLISQGKISQIEREIDTKGKITVINAKGKYLFAGGIDAHTHMELPMGDFESSDDFASGTKAALIGGTTTIIDFANQEKGKSAFDAYTKWRSKADHKVNTDYALHVSITDVNEATLNDIKKLYQEEGVTSFKTFMAYPNMKISEDDFRTLVKFLNENIPNYLLTVHAEMGSKIEELRNKATNLSPSEHPLTRPIECEDEAVMNFIKIIEDENGRGYVVHLTSTNAAKELLLARERGVQIFTETCPQYLFLNDELYTKDGTSAMKAIMSPPLRSQKNQTELNNFLSNSKTEGIQVIATDHCPFLMKNKERGINDFKKVPNGAPGVEERFSLIFSEFVMTKKISTIDFTKMISENPAKLFGLYPQKGVIAVGSDADLVIVDPNKNCIVNEKELHMNSDYSLYHGKEIQGKIETVICRGEIVYANNTFSPPKEKGQYLKRS